MVSFNGNEGTLRERIAVLEAQVRVLQAEEERTTIALAASDVGVFDWNLDARRIYVSPILKDLLGYGESELPGDLAGWLEHVEADDRYRVQSEMRDALMYGRDHFKAVYRMRRKDGSIRHFLFRAVIMRKPPLDGGGATRVLGTATDLTQMPTSK